MKQRMQRNTKGDQTAEPLGQILKAAQPALLLLLFGEVQVEDKVHLTFGAATGANTSARAGTPGQHRARRRRRRRRRTEGRDRVRSILGRAAGGRALNTRPRCRRGLSGVRWLRIGEQRRRGGGRGRRRGRGRRCGGGCIAARQMIHRGGWRKRRRRWRPQQRWQGGRDRVGDARGARGRRRGVITVRSTEEFVQFLLVNVRDKVGHIHGGTGRASTVANHRFTSADRIQRFWIRKLVGLTPRQSSRHHFEITALMQNQLKASGCTYTDRKTIEKHFTGLVAHEGTRELNLFDHFQRRRSW
mmetsp:Transcript_38508/g.96925  ORF Transcript_38508/g.96925 Transcript_38508/m.96925 type:complete len:301 (-) Transcript_38508:1014-1916(-)